MIRESNPPERGTPSAPAGEREAVYLMRRTDEAAWHVTTFQTFEHIASGKSPQHEAVKLYAAPAQPAAPDQSEVQRLREDLALLADYVWRKGCGLPLPNYPALGRFPVDVAKAALAASTGQEAQP